MEAEHDTIDEGIAAYMQTLEAVRKGEKSLQDLVPVARDVRLRSELHFGKEELSVVRPLQQRLSSEEFRPVIAEIDQRLGDWLRTHGWQWSSE